MGVTKSQMWDNTVNWYFDNNFECPQPKDLANKYHVSVNAVKQLFDFWVKEMKMELIVKYGSSVAVYDFTDIQKEIFDRELAEYRSRIASDEPKTRKEGKDTTKSKKTLNLTDFKGFALKGLCLVISVILLTCSIHFTFEFNNKSMNWFWAIMLSLAVCGFSGFAFSIADEMKDKTKYIVMAMWVVGTFYSVFTAIGTQYNNFMEFKSADVSSTIESQTKTIEKQIANLQKRADALYYFREQEMEYNMNTELKVENPSTWKLIKERTSELSETENSIIELQNRLLELSLDESENTVHKTVYSWLEDITDISSDFWQFLVMCFPAVFIDLTVSVLIKFVFEKEKKNGKHK